MNRFFAGGLLLFVGADVSAQVFVAPLYDPFAPAPVFLVPAPLVATPTRAVDPPISSESQKTDYPPSKSHPRIVHERHYVPRGANISHYMADRKPTEYGPEVALVIRDFYFTDEKLKEVPSERAKKEDAPPPKSSSAGKIDDLIQDLDEKTGRAAKEKSGVRVPSPNEADPPKSEGKKGDDKTRYPPETPEKKSDPGKSNDGPLSNEGSKKAGGEVQQPDESQKPPANPPKPAEQASNGLSEKWQIVRGSVISARGATPIADMQIDFVDLGGEMRDSTVRTDADGRFEARLEPGNWQAYLVVSEKVRRKLGTIEVKTGDATIHGLKF